MKCYHHVCVCGRRRREGGGGVALESKPFAALVPLVMGKGLAVEGTLYYG